MKLHLVGIPSGRASANAPCAAETRFDGGRCRNINKNSNKKDSVN